MLASLWLTSTAVATVYKWIDKNGVVHYSDKPVPGATPVVVAPAQTYQAPKPIAAKPAQNNPVAGVSTEELGCTLQTPIDGQTFANTTSVVFNFAGPKGTTPVLELDNRRFTAKPNGIAIVVEPIVRGEHAARMVFLRAGGAVLCSTPRIKFVVRQPGLLNNPARRPAR